jgi:hypothetical protein
MIVVFAAALVVMGEWDTAQADAERPTFAGMETSTRRMFSSATDVLNGQSDPSLLPQAAAPPPGATAPPAPKPYDQWLGDTIRKQERELREQDQRDERKREQDLLDEHRRAERAGLDRATAR